MRVCAFLLLLSTTTAVAASAQSLADVARQENERREAVKASGKSYSNKDLKTAPTPEGADRSAADSGTAAATAPSSGGSATDKATDASDKPADGSKAAADAKADAADSG